MYRYFNNLSLYPCKDSTAWAVEYTDGTSAEAKIASNECPVVQSDWAAEYTNFTSEEG